MTTKYNIKLLTKSVQEKFRHDPVKLDEKLKWIEEKCGIKQKTSYIEAED